jgi:hypothetical protein
MPTICKEIDIDVELDDFYDEDIIEEFERRGLALKMDNVFIRQFYDRYRVGKVSADEVIKFVDTVIYNSLGKII